MHSFDGRWSRTLPVLLCLLLCAGAVRAQRGSQPIPIDTDGWTAVRLDGEALAFSGVDLTLFDAGGAVVARRLVVADDDGGRRAARIESVGETADGWLVTLALGASPPRHTRLLFAVEGETVARAVTLDASDDGTTWRPLAVADLFRLGDRGGLQRLAIDYPPTEASLLRLRWPRAAGLPVLEDVAVTTLGDERGAVVLEGEVIEAVDGGASRAFDVPAPAHLARRLDVELAVDGGAVGYRLLRAVDGRWRILAEGSRAASERDTETLRIPLQLDATSEAAGGATLRLDLWTADATSGLVNTVTLRRAALDLVFAARAEQAPYRLAWGFATPPAQEAPAAEPHDPRRATPGEVTLGPWPSLPERMTAPGADTPERAVAIGVVTATADASGDPSALEGLAALRLDASLLDDPSRLDPRRLRLAHDGRQVPFVSRTLDRPALAWSLSEAPRRGEGGISRIALVALEEGPDLADWRGVLAVSARGPFARRLRLVFEQPSRPGVDARTRVLDGWREWRCEAPSPPCRHEIEIGAALSQVGAADAGQLRLEIDDGDDAPLDEVAVALWREVLELRFVWPGASPRLLALDGARAPVYDLDTLLRRQVLARPATPVRLVAAGAADEAPATWWLPLALGVAGLALLLVLVRLLRDATRDSSAE